MYGRDTAVSGAKTAQIAPTPPVVGGVANKNAKGDGSSVAMYPFVLAAGVVLYFVWAILEQHQRIRNAIQPKQIGINLRNLLVIMVTVVLGLNLFKVLAVKLSATVSSLTGGAVRLRWLVYLAGGA